MSSALRRGRTLDPFAVDKANQWRLKRLEELEHKSRGKLGLLKLTHKERHELHNLQVWKERIDERTDQARDNQTTP